MFNDDNNNTGPVYLKHRNFAESAYRQQQPQPISAVQFADSAFNSKANKGNNISKLEIQDDLGMPVNYVRIKALEDDIRMNIISDKNSLHRAITPVLILAQMCALLPVQGIRGKNTSYLVFNWYSWPVIYVFIVIAASLLILSFSLIKIYMTGLTYYSTGEIMFFGSSLVIYILFIHLAREWPKVMEKWELMEREMRQFGYPSKTAFKFKILTSIIMVLAIIEHSASVLTGIMKAIPCSTGGLDIFRAYFSMSFRQVFALIDYSLVIAIPLGFLNLMLACAWNYMDLFIIILACALSDKFKQLNQKLASIKGKVLPSTYWRKSRETYNLLASLTQDFDEFLSPVILLSFANNLYFICLQLLNSLKPMHNVWEAIYFVFSFTYLVGRTCAVSLYAASINDQSKKPKAILFSVPTESYGVEVARFLTQVTSDELALTGCNFFSVTRTLMLTVAGTIVTYEIVLIQFNSVNSDGNGQNHTIVYCP
ncbi:gustatory receptor for sugar taste 64f-like [Acyrthosiphon pisum]|uniref:Gustatory receptor n=1 Tax=Acyrthosiphon pisum TaxID=7029 RepID=A0A8R1VY63_ACYPI|nr:gustatory receptor for sugar taste 64f-like [Acyrthosiphon pisum]|eukprot:XP_001942787.2 PREDICTED: gustatory receptor for sugar taste 64f-like [Acyrthosiphon pisum]